MRDLRHHRVPRPRVRRRLPRAAAGGRPRERPGRSWSSPSPRRPGSSRRSWPRPGRPRTWRSPTREPRRSPRTRPIAVAGRPSRPAPSRPGGPRRALVPAARARRRAHRLEARRPRRRGGRRAARDRGPRRRDDRLGRAAGRAGSRATGSSSSRAAVACRPPTRAIPRRASVGRGDATAARLTVRCGSPCSRTSTATSSPSKPCSPMPGPVERDLAPRRRRRLRPGTGCRGRAAGRPRRGRRPRQPRRGGGRRRGDRLLQPRGPAAMEWTRRQIRRADAGLAARPSRSVSGATT